MKGIFVHGLDRAYVEITFAPSERREKRLRECFSSPWRFDGDLRYLKAKRIHGLMYIVSLARLPLARVRASARKARRVEGVRSVSLTTIVTLPPPQRKR